MSCKIYTFPSFDREAKRLNKRYKSFKSDLKELMNELSFSPSLVGCSKFESKIRYKKWCYFGAAKLLIFNTLIYEIVL